MLENVEKIQERLFDARTPSGEQRDYLGGNVEVQRDLFYPK